MIPLTTIMTETGNRTTSKQQVLGHRTETRGGAARSASPPLIVAMLESPPAFSTAISPDIIR